MRITLRSIATALPLALALAAPVPAEAQTYPNRAVKMIVPFGAGGPADLYARALAKYLSDETKQPFVIENRPGAGAVIGTDAVAKSPADGYTLLVMSNTHTTNESLIPNKPYDLMRDFVPVAPINYSDLLMVVHPSVEAKTVAEFVALAKKDAGKLNYASSGPGTPYHMAGELFKAMSKTDIVHIPHKASGDARNSVLSGNVQMMLDAVTTMTELATGGKVRAVATTGLTRNPLTPDLPTVAETIPGYEATIWLGVMAPKDTPKEVVAYLNAAIKKVVNAQEVKDTWQKQGAVPMAMTPPEFDAYMRKDIDKWAEVVKVSGAKVQ
ncbi:MAG: tripartite tricarboxylate transporter substrate binding protein [Pseudolabrys sp.]|nr:tripartite tricarboxylate transporter substrate binding protein [Pseudolabrys sp.]